MMRPLISVCTVTLLACGGPNPTLTVTVDGTPARTTDNSLLITGSVTRSPAGDKPITVSVAGGRNVLVDSISGTTVFAFSLTLNENQENQIAVTASEGGSVVSEPVIFSIIHDNQGPMVQDMTPTSQSTEVSLDTPIEAFFSEPLQSSTGANVRLLQNGMTVPGNAVISTDMRRVTFQPAQPLLPNSVYELELNGYTDETGNAVPANQACFLTSTVVNNLITEIDTLDLGWFRGVPNNAVDNDLMTSRVARIGSTMLWTLEFSRPSIGQFPHDSSTLVYIEIDTDQDMNTGFTSIRDTVVADPEFQSQTGVEAVIAVEPAFGDSGFVGVNAAALSWNVLETFVAGRCGRYIGFHNTTLIDSAVVSGAFDYATISFVLGSDGDFIDIMPEGGHFTADLSAAPAVWNSPRIDYLPPARGPAVRGVRSLVLDRFGLPRRRR